MDGKRILVVDDDPDLLFLVAHGVKSLSPDYQVSTANSAGAALEQVQKQQYDLIVTDFMMPDMTGLEVTEQLLVKQPKLKILVLSSFADILVPFHLLEAGAKSYLTKNTPQTEFIEAIRNTHKGQRIISPSVANNLALTHVNDSLKESNPFNKLSPHQLKVTKQILRGKTNEEIADKMQVESKSIYNHRSRILKKMKLKNDVELTLLAWRHKMLWLDQTEE